MGGRRCSRRRCARRSRHGRVRRGLRALGPGEQARGAAAAHHHHSTLASLTEEPPRLADLEVRRAAVVLGVHHDLPLELPRAATGEAAPQLLAVTIDQHGAISLDAAPVDERALREHVRRMQRQAGGAALTAAIAADGRARHAQVVRVVDVLRQERVTRFALHVEAAPEPGR